MEILEVEHVVERLHCLAAWRTPGVPPPKSPFPIGEHVWLRQAAERLARMAADREMEAQDQPQGVARDENWPHWALIDSRDGAIRYATSTGYDNVMQRLRHEQDEMTPGVRSLTVRPLMIGRRLTGK